jgi:hypothetical protein
MLSGEETAGFNVMAAVADCVGSAKLFAVSVTVCVVRIADGAVYNPFTKDPTLGLRDQLTPVFNVPVTLALNWLEPPALRVIDAGESVMETGASVIVALADLVGSAMLVAFTVTVCWLLIEAGAV